MQAKYKTLLIIGVVALLAVAFFAVLYEAGKNPVPGRTPSSGNVPDYALDASEETVVKEVAANFVSLYNTYSADDFSNLTSMGDYQTTDMQRQTLDYVAHLKDTVPAGYSIRTDANAASFSYRYPAADTLTVSLEASVSEQVPQQGATFQTLRYTALANLQFTKIGGHWLISSISYQKKP